MLLPLFCHHWFGSKWLAVVGARGVKSLTQGDDDEGLQAGWNSGLGQRPVEILVKTAVPHSAVADHRVWCGCGSTSKQAKRMFNSSASQAPPSASLHGMLSS